MPVTQNGSKKSLVLAVKARVHGTGRLRVSREAGFIEEGQARKTLAAGRSPG